MLHTCQTRFSQKENDIENDGTHVLGNQKGSKSKSLLAGNDQKKVGDFNFFRKVSKYDIDRLRVDWGGYQKERTEQQTKNNL